MRLASFNVNGIRAAQRRGFEPWLTDTQADVLALQEVRCPVAALPSGVFGDHVVSYHAGDRAGRNGVAVLTREVPTAVRVWGPDAVVLQRDQPIEVPQLQIEDSLARELRHFAHQGRYLEVDLADRPLTVGSLYLPKGGTPFEDEESLARYERKMKFLAGFARQLTRSRKRAQAAGREFVVMGDFNVAHTELDLKAWKTNKKSEGFLPEERSWFCSITSARTLIDVVRRLHPDTPGPYTWWSWMGQAWQRDAGWRIDYQLATPALAKRAIAGGTHRAPSYEERISDHAPAVVDYAD